MQRSLGDFAGFKVQKKMGDFFDPFMGEQIGGTPLATFGEPAPAPAPTPLAKEVKKEVVNILDAPESAVAPTTQVWPAPAPAPVATLFPDYEEPVPMIQPRTKEGGRLLYKYPKVPRVGVKGSYSLLVGESDRSEAAWLIQFDGAANPNPGPASSGAVLWSPKDLDGRRNPVFESGKYLGRATNNIAEVQGLLLGLQIAATRGARELLIEGDSELIIFQQTGKYKVSDKNLKRWWAEIQAAMMDETAFDWIAIRQVPRELNERADSITKEVLSRKASFQRA